MTAPFLRPFQDADAPAVSALIQKTLQLSNGKDYPPEQIAALVAQFTAEGVLQRAAWTHFYVACAGSAIIGCGAIGPYWGSETESSLFTIFVLPDYQGSGVGRRIVEILEQDPFALRACRIEVPASITARGFYEKMGYACKAGIPQPDHEQMFRMEKYR